MELVGLKKSGLWTYREGTRVAQATPEVQFD